MNFKRITIITLNVHGGIDGPERLLRFFNKYRGTTDIFCLQEICNRDDRSQPFSNPKIVPDLLKRVARVLPRHQYFFAEHMSTIRDYGMAMFVRSDLSPRNVGTALISTHTPTDTHDKDHDRIVQHITCNSRYGRTPFVVMNIHGMWHPSGKGDCPERIAQMQKILRLSDRFEHPTILAGDFNARPDTESMRIFLDAGFRNLITDYRITDTRTAVYIGKERYADYMLMTDDGRIDVHTFRVLPELVSDHAALLLECDIV